MIRYFYKGQNKGYGAVKYAPNCIRHAATKLPATRQELAWAAGVVDGEGHIAVIRPVSHGKRRHMLALVVANTNPRLPEKMQDLFGGSISVRAGRNNGKEQHVWSVSAMKAFVALKRLQPFIVGKVEEVAVVMRFAATVSGSKPRVTSPAVLVLREECRMELMRLHRRWRPTARRKQVVGQA